MNNENIERLIPSINELGTLLKEYNENQIKKIRYKIEYLISNLNFSEIDRKEFEEILWVLFNKILDKENLKKLVYNSVILKTFFSKYLNTISRRSFLKGLFGGAMLTLAFPNTALGNVMKSLYDKIDFHDAGDLKNPKFILYHVTAGYGGKDSLKALKQNIHKGVHYVIERNGSVIELIPENKVAYHAGQTQWGKYTLLNDYALGIENVDNNTGKITDAQYKALKKLIKDLMDRYHIPKERVLPHGATYRYKYNNRWVRGGKPCGLKISRKRLSLGKIPEDDLVKKGILGRNVQIERYVALLNDEFNGSLQKFTEVKKEVEYQVLNTISREISAYNIAGNDYKSPKTIYLFPNGTAYSGNQISDWTKLPDGTKIYLNENLGNFKRFSLKSIDYYPNPEKRMIYSITGGLYNTSYIKYVLDNGTIIDGENYSKDLQNKRCVIITNTVGKVYSIDKQTAYSVIGKEYNTVKIAYLVPATKEEFEKTGKKFIVRLGNDPSLNFNSMPNGTKFVLRDVA